MGNSWRCRHARPGPFSSELRELQAVEVYNKLQDTRELILVVDTTLAHVAEMDDDTAEVNFLPPERFKRLLLEVIAKRRARGWTVVVMCNENGPANPAEDLRRWIYEKGLGCESAETVRDPNLVNEVCRMAGDVEGFYHLFPWLSPKHDFFEAGRLYPSLIARDRGSYLFLSNFGIASDPYIYHALDIKFVVNCTRDLPFADEVAALLQSKPAGSTGNESQAPIRTDLRVELIDRFRVPVDDSVHHQICEHFADSVRFIAEAMEKQEGHVLIHCKHGQSRSATIAAAYLLYDSQQKGTPKTVNEILADLKHCRPRVSPNEGFLKQLQEAFEQH